MLTLEAILVQPLLNLEEGGQRPKKAERIDRIGLDSSRNLGKEYECLLLLG